MGGEASLRGGWSNCRDLIVHPSKAHKKPVERNEEALRRIDKLPPEIIRMVASHLEAVRDVANLELTCKAVREAVEGGPEVWRALTLKKFPAVKVGAAEKGGVPWKKLYRFHHDLFGVLALGKKPHDDSPLDPTAFVDHPFA